MVKDTMTSKERVEAAIHLEEVDRTPVGLLPLQGFVYKYLGKSVSSGFKDRLENPDAKVQSAEDALMKRWKGPIICAEQRLILCMPLAWILYMAEAVMICLILLCRQCLI